jgi:hypothetical protein
MSQKKSKIKVTEQWQSEVLANLLGEEKLFELTNGKKNKKYELKLVVKRGKRIKQKKNALEKGKLVTNET